MNNRQGWYRLGVVLTIAWVLAICAITAYEYFFALPSDELWFVAYVHVPDWARDQNSTVVWVDTSIKLKPLLLSILVPPALRYGGSQPAMPWLRR